jgi:hypothetical protein
MADGKNDASDGEKLTLRNPCDHRGPWPDYITFRGNVWLLCAQCWQRWERQQREDPDGKYEAAVFAFAINPSGDNQ